jgi:integration host factor subunit alpha
MTKADLVENVYLKTGFSKKESAEIVEMVFDIMKTTLEDGVIL